MAVAAAAALPAYEVLIAPGSADRRELCAALAVRLKELPLRIEARVLPAAGDPFAQECGIDGARCAAVLVLGPASAGPSYALEQLYAQLVERCGSRILAVFSAEPITGLEPAAAVGAAALRARLRERHRTRVLPAGSTLEELSQAISGFVCAMLCEELSLRHAAELDQLFAEPDDASPARLAELLARESRAAFAEHASGTSPAHAHEPAPQLETPAARAAAQPLAAREPGESELDPLREPARARALEQRRQGLRAFALGEDAVAIGHLRGALQELPLDAPSGYWLARLLLAQGGRAAAVEASRSAQRAARVAASAGRGEDAALAHLAAARAEAELGHPQQAEQQARAALSCAPWLAEPWIELACLCAHRLEFEAGERALREAFQRDPRALLRLNRELPPGEAPDAYRAWKRELRAELATAVCAALDAERRIARQLAEDSASSPEPTPARAPQDPASLPILDLLALGREATERTLVRLSALARQLRASAAELGVIWDPQQMGELVPLRVPPPGSGAAAQVLNWLYEEGELVTCGRPVLRYEVRDRNGRSQHTLSAPRSGVLTHIAVANGALPAGEGVLGALRALPGAGAELADRLEHSRAEEAELKLSAHRSGRESSAAGRRAAFWAAAAAALLSFAMASFEGTLVGRQAALPSALIGLCAAPAVYGAWQALRRHGSARRAEQRREALGEQIAESERELAHLWDDFRLLADRFARAAVSFEEGLPEAPLFASGPTATPRASARTALLQLRSGEPIPGVVTDEQLFPPELAAQLELAPATPRSALYRVIESTSGGVRAARWATYFPPSG